MKIRPSNVPDPFQPQKPLSFDGTRSANKAAFSASNKPATNKLSSSSKITDKLSTREIASCIHNKGKTGISIGRACNRREQHRCALHEFCILSKCTSSGGLKVCNECPDIAPEGSEAAKKYNEENK